MALPVVLGFMLPMLLLLQLGSRRLSELFTGDTLWSIGNSMLLAVLACLITLCLALTMAHLGRSQQWRAITATTRLASLGYALPGTVLGIGLLVPFGQFDQWLNRMIVAAGGVGPGLVLSGGLFALLYAYATRFLIIPVGQIEDSMAKIPTNIDHVARTLGRTKAQIFRSIHVPLLRPSIISAALLVFVDAMKELPATLMLRPFDFETLATRVFTLASLGQFESAAGPALLIVLAGFIPVVVLFHNLRQAGAT
jgi:iron(III) transport system permease protein